MLPGVRSSALPQRAFVVVVDLDEAEQAAKDLPCRRAVGVRVVPVEAGAIAHLEGVVVACARRNQHFAVAVVARVHRRGRANARSSAREAHWRASMRSDAPVSVTSVGSAMVRVPAAASKASASSRARARSVSASVPTARRASQPSLPGTYSGCTNAPSVAHRSRALSVAAREVGHEAGSSADVEPAARSWSQRRRVNGGGRVIMMAARRRGRPQA